MSTPRSSNNGDGVLMQSTSCPPMDVMDETIKKVDEMLGKVETGFAVFMDRILKKCKKHLTENSVKALFECAICQETIIETTFIKCKHFFCEFCLLKWLKLNFNCPVCREYAVVAGKNKLVDGVIDAWVELSFSDEQKTKRNKEIQQRRSVPVTTEEPSLLSNDALESSNDDNPASVLPSPGSSDSVPVVKPEVELGNMLDHLHRIQRISCVEKAVVLFVEFSSEIFKYSSPEELIGPKNVKPGDDNESPEDLPSFFDVRNTFREDFIMFRSISDSYQSEYRSRLTAVSSNSEV